MDGGTWWATVHVVAKSWTWLSDCTFTFFQLCPTLLQPHGLLPPRLLCLWDFPGRNPGVSSHVLLQGPSQPRDGTRISYIFCTAGRFLTNILQFKKEIVKLWMISTFFEISICHSRVKFFFTHHFLRLFKISLFIWDWLVSVKCLYRETEV